MPKYITKNLFLSTLSCPTYGHLQQSQPTQQQSSISDELRIEEGIEIQLRARKLFSDGVMVSGSNDACVLRTRELLSNPSVSTIFEATFQNGPYITKADMLIRKRRGWKLIEIKSNVNLTEKLIDDLAYTTMIAKRVGLNITSCSLLLVNKDYRLGMDNKKLFVENDVSKKVFNRIIDFEESYDSIARILSQKEKPTPELKWECKGCDIFSECGGCTGSA